MAKIRTRARAVDMLGRQQIAGIPNAISELFKNAHDAYATRVEADFFRPEQLFVLRDDGLGMTLRDVEDRWLVLGTESKMTGDRELDAVASGLQMERRIPTGEKGIGRLAIAAIGPQVLLLTRARRGDGLHSTVAAFVNWTLFTLPGISLDEIEIPVREFLEGRLPDARDIQGLLDVVRNNLDQLRDRIDQNSVSQIYGELETFDIDASVLQSRFQTSSLAEGRSGTQFYIQPTDQMLRISLEEGEGRRRIGDLKRMLIGFTNTMMPHSVPASILTEFHDHHSADFSESIIGAEAFFTPDEFVSADHHIRGQFDEFGQFQGTVSVYGGEPGSHSIAWTEARGRRTDCGPFSIEFAYVQGAQRDSVLAPEQWHGLTSKLDVLGGLYIYRNGIRILPYGNTENDFLRIEERRNLGAAYYFFSYRRMIGAIELPASSADKLVEKAGREGFRENRAYRQFRAILENFFVQLAADYFRDDTIRSNQFTERREELNRQAKALDLQSRQARTRRNQLISTLNDRSAKLQNGQASMAVDEILDDLDRALLVVHEITDPDLRSQAVLRAEATARQRVVELRNDFRVPVGRGFALSRDLRQRISAYSAEFAKLNEEVFGPSLARISEHLAETIEGLGVDVDRRRRFDHNVNVTRNAAQVAVSGSRRDSQTVFDETAEKVQTAIRGAGLELDAALRDIGLRVQRTDLNALSESELVSFSIEMESEVESLAQEKQDLLDAITQQLKAISVQPDDSGEIISQIDIVEAAEERLLVLQERADADLELTQLGMAIDIIDHEFQSTIRSVRNNLRRLRAWADVNVQLQPVYDGIKVNFDHLDGYLTLFTPLHRRLYRTEIEIKGSEINKFLQDLFSERLTRHDIRLRATGKFLSYRLKGYPSTFYPVFVNLVDNATFWLRDQLEPRVITLDSDGSAVYVSDTGPGIPAQDREAIFELGFTRKPGGRGLGLYISRDVLNREHFDLKVSDNPNGMGAMFVIQPTETVHDD